MSERRLEIDDRLLLAAQDILGTASWSETVNQALAGVVDGARRIDADVAMAGEPLSTNDPDRLRGEWRSGKPPL